MDAYIPVACSFHDELEHLAMRRTPCRFRLANDDAVDAEGVIADIITSGGAEYVVLEGSGRRIRLDHIKAIAPLKRSRTQLPLR